MDLTLLNKEVEQKSQQFQIFFSEIEKVIVGQRLLIDRLLIGLLTNGHILVEGVPGLAKTLTINTLSKVMKGIGCNRIQFTPDLLPADLIGTQIYEPKSGNFSIKKGPVFNNIILADEINRAPAKVQSALLEAMQERQVTIGDKTFILDEPFLVMATQNPIEQEGTYPLPEAQVDRFMLKIYITHPNKEEELEILNRMGGGNIPEVNEVLSKEDIFSTQALVNTIYVDDKVKRYILDVVFATREPSTYSLDIGQYLLHGASPRASIGLLKASRAIAFLGGRGYVTPQDVKDVALDVLRHRVALSYEADAEELSSDDIILKILSAIDVP